MDTLRTLTKGINLDLAGLLILADLQTVAKRTVLTGTSAWLDIFVLAPGLHRQTSAPDLSKSEYPACAAMTSGYVFRVENQATVHYLQSVGRPGHLTTIAVSSTAETQPEPALAYIAYHTTVAVTVAILSSLVMIGDVWAISAIAILMLARLINTAVVRRLATPGWFGALEPGNKSALLVLLSQDRWIRIEGATDDVKAVTSGTWLEKPTLLENALLAFSTLLSYFDVAVTANATQEGKILVMGLLLTSSALLGLANQATGSTSMMHGRQLSVRQKPKKYNRRLDLARELIKEFRRTDCFVGMGMIQPKDALETQKSYETTVVM